MTRPKQVHPPTNGGRLIIGVGNACRSDDGAGILVARRLAQVLTDPPVLESYGEGASLMEAWNGADHVVLIDAVRSGLDPGRIHRLDASKTSIPSDFFNYSTHAFSVAEAVEMSRALGTLPPRFVIYGIEGASFAAGTELSPAVASAVDEVARRVALEFCKTSPRCTDVEATHA